MRTVRYSDWQQERRRALAQQVKLGARRGTSSKLRDQSERALLSRLDKAQLDAWQKSGRLIRIGPRRYRIDTSVPA